MPRIKWIAAVMFVTMFLLSTGPGCSLFRQQDPVPEAEEDTITFSAADLFTGETLHFPDDFPDQVVYLIFFADG